MRSCGWTRRLVPILLGALLLAGSAASALANSGDRQATQADQFEEQLEAFDDARGSEAAKEDIEQAQAWLDSARSLIAEGKGDAADRMLRRVKLSLDLIGALVKADQIEQAADEQEAIYYRAKEEQIPELEAEIEELEDQKRELEQEIADLR